MSARPINPELEHLLRVLCDQSRLHMGEGKERDCFNHLYMGAGQGAVHVLAHYGLVDTDENYASLTAAGRALIAQSHDMSAIRVSECLSRMILDHVPEQPIENPSKLQPIPKGGRFILEAMAGMCLQYANQDPLRPLEPNSTYVFQDQFTLHQQAPVAEALSELARFGLLAVGRHFATWTALGDEIFARDWDAED